MCFNNSGNSVMWIVLILLILIIFGGCGCGCNNGGCNSCISSDSSNDCGCC